ncbi:VHS1055 protein [Vibrio phage 1]|nr:VHS1055 protein [Vibrio phage 1]
MLLASVAELRARVNVADSPVYNRVLTDLLLNVTLGIETHLDTKFARKEYTAKYFAGSNNYLVTGAPGRVANGSPGVLHLLLEGLNASGLKVSLGSSLASSGSTTAASNYNLEDRGIVALFNGWLPDQYITVTYTGGFEVETVDGELVYKGVPLIIKQAALIFAEHVFMTKYGDSQIEEAQPGEKDYTDPPNSVTQILYQYNRNAPHALRSVI